jgi:hypothetical protein
MNDSVSDAHLQVSAKRKFKHFNFTSLKFSDNVTITQNIVKTDGQIWMLGYECFTNADGSPGLVGWSVYSIYNTVPDSLRQEIQGYIRDLGFDPRDIREPSYDNCPPVPNPYPELITHPVSDPFKLRPAPQFCNPPASSSILPGSSWVHYANHQILKRPTQFFLIF